MNSAPPRTSSRFRGLNKLTAPVVEPMTTAEAKLFLKVDHVHDDALIDELVAAARGMAEEFTRRSFLEQTWQLRRDTIVGGVELHRPPLLGVQAVRYWPEVTPAPNRGRGAKLDVSGDNATLDRVLTGATSCAVTDGVDLVFEDEVLTVSSINTADTDFTGASGITDGVYFVDFYADATAVWSRFLDFNVEHFDTPPVLRPDTETDSLPDVAKTAGAPWWITYDTGYSDAASALPENIVAAVKLILARLYEDRGDDLTESRRGSIEVDLPAAAKALLRPFVVPLAP